MEYPTRNINILKSYFSQKEINEIIFIDNENLFYESFKKGEYRDYFVDSCYGSFGHTTNKGSKKIAEHVATILEKEFINLKY